MSPYWILYLELSPRKLQAGIFWFHRPGVHPDNATTRAAKSKSGRGQPHSKTLREELECAKIRKVLECGCPLPLSLGPRHRRDGTGMRCRGAARVSSL